MKIVFLRVILMGCIGVLAIVSYSFGYNDGKQTTIYESDLACGLVLHQIINMQCPEVYDILMEGNKQNLKGE